MIYNVDKVKKYYTYQVYDSDLLDIYISLFQTFYSVCFYYVLYYVRCWKINMLIVD